jgi:thiol-disulfide isomerase/thioredoxin
MLRTAFLLPFLLLATAAAPAGSSTLDTRWTTAARAAAVKSGGQVRLPEVRVYDTRGRLLLRSFGGGKPGTIVPQVMAALRAGKALAGPSLAETMRALETRDGRAALPQVRANPRIVVVDYWASWCVGCKVVSRELADWNAKQGGKVLLVRAETDPMQGKPVKHRYFDKNGKELRAD